MKTIIAAVLLLSLNIAHSNIGKKCSRPVGLYTGLEVVLDQFVFKNGNPNWGDWCYEMSPEEGKLCNTELNQWDEWLVCSEKHFESHCQDYADKENFLFGETEEKHKAFISKCVKDNYRALLNQRLFIDL